MPSFNGDDIFGFAVKMTTDDNPRGAQTNAFPGVSGLEELDQGLRGRFTVVTGIHSAPDPFSLAAAQNLFRSYNDGLAYVLVDTLGNTWSPVKYDSFSPSPKIRVMNAPGGGVVYFQSYQARLKHL